MTAYDWISPAPTLWAGTVYSCSELQVIFSLPSLQHGAYMSMHVWNLGNGHYNFGDAKFIFTRLNLWNQYIGNSDIM